MNKKEQVDEKIKELINPDYEGYADCELFTTNF